jgi:thiamine-monophosphate kinase
MRETEIVARIRALAGRGYRHPALVEGIGDDCAILRPAPNEDLVFTSDLVIEGRHFTLETHSPVDIGHKALARSLSDLAAMGSEPVFCLISLAIPPQLASSWTRRFYSGLLALADRFKITLAGGDLSRSDRVTADVTCCGRVPRGQAILRSGAQPGDRIFVTGELGASAHGLLTRRGKAWRRHLRPEPRIQSGVALRRLRVSAAIDVSDGLALDLHRLCLESRVSAELEANLPITRAASLEQALFGGDDYELLFTASRKVRVPRQVAGVPVTEIGTITRGPSGRILFSGRPLAPQGFDHFA